MGDLCTLKKFTRKSSLIGLELLLDSTIGSTIGRHFGLEYNRFFNTFRINNATWQTIIGPPHICLTCIKFIA